MKKNTNTSYIIMLVTIIVTISACNKGFLEPNPLSIYTPDNTYKNADGLNAALNAAAKNMWYENIAAPTAPYTTQLFFSDEAVNGATDNTTAKDFVAQLNPDDVTLNPSGGQFNIIWYWRSVFIGVKYANTVITYIDIPQWDTTNTKSKMERNAILGGAYFWRAYCYYYLVNCFGDVPWVGKLYLNPKLDFQSTKREVILRKLKKDLQFAQQWVTDDVPRGQVTKGAVLHLLTKVNLALGDFDDAIQSASEVINGGTYHLMTGRFGVDANDPSKNIIWDLHQAENKSLPQNKEGLLQSINREDIPGNLGANQTIYVNGPYWHKNINTPNGNTGTTDQVGIEFDQDSKYGRGVAFCRPTWYSTHNIWNNDVADLRHAPGNWMKMEDLVYNNTALKGKDDYYGKHLQKYSDNGALLVSDTIRSWFDWPAYKLFVYDPNTASSKQAGGYSDSYIFRLAETYLLRAEAYWWKGDLADATTDINAVRERAGARPFTSSEVNLGTILDERARELYYEEPRKVELTRLAYLFAQTGKPAPTGKTYSMTDFTTNNFWYDWVIRNNEFYRNGVIAPLGTKYTISAHMVLWPIPQSAIDGNTGGVINQNSGYTGTNKNVPPLDQIAE